MEDQNQKWEAVIGLEIHAELKTKSKMFCGCKNSACVGNKQLVIGDMQYATSDMPNTNICPVCLGMPGTLPVLNKKAIEMTILTGLALNCKVGHPNPRKSALYSKWDRKNYFYPDLPKGYQISQYDLPLVHGGHIEISNFQFPISNKIPNSKYQTKKIKITRIHLEEDTGTSKHPEGKVNVDYSLLDFNRAGVPLMELVTDPDLRSAQEAKEFCKQYQLILRTLNVSDADMEKGQMRCEANISVRKCAAPLGTKVEVKNLNSFKSVERAIEYEIERQIDALESDEKIIQETRGWNEKKNKTYVMRIKETSADYRYFPEPDLPPILLAERELTRTETRTNADKIEINIEEIKKQLPELPQERVERYQKDYKLSMQDAVVIASNPKMAQYLELSIKYLVLSIKQIANRKSQIANIVNWIINEIPDLSIKPKHLVELVDLIKNDKISQKIAKEILPDIKKGKSPKEIIKTKGIKVLSNEKELEKIIDKIIKNNPDAVKKIKSGQMGVMGFLVGQVMSATQGKANPKVVNEILRKRIS